MKKMVVLGIDHGHCNHIIRAANERDDVELTAIAQETAPFADEKCSQLGVREYRSYADCLDCEKPDIVGLAMFNGARGKWVKDVVSRGSALIADKPLCVTADEISYIRRETEKTGTPVCMMLTERTNQKFVAVKNAVDGGKIGKPLFVEAMRYYALNYPNRPEWMFARATYGGPAVDILIHDFDLARWITGCRWSTSCISENSSGSIPEKDFQDQAQLTAEENGIRLSLSMSWNSPGGHHGRFCVYGTEGYIEVPLWSAAPPRIFRDGKLTDLELPEKQDFAVMFFDALLNGGEYPITTEESLSVMEGILNNIKS